MVATFLTDRESTATFVFPSNTCPATMCCAPGFHVSRSRSQGLSPAWRTRRQELFFADILDILKLQTPSHVILENVGNFERHDHGRTWHIVRSSLGRLGYEVRATRHKASGGDGLLSPHHLGFPHHRERFFAVASRVGVPKKHLSS